MQQMIIVYLRTYQLRHMHTRETKFNSTNLKVKHEGS